MPAPTADIGKDVVVGLGGKENRQYAEELAGQGFRDPRARLPRFGDYKDARQRAAYARGYTSMTMKGIWNHMRCVDLLQSLPKWIESHRLHRPFLGGFNTRCSWACLMNGSGDGHELRVHAVREIHGRRPYGLDPRRLHAGDRDGIRQRPAKMPFDFPDILAAPRTVFINARQR